MNENGNNIIPGSPSAPDNNNSGTNMPPKPPVINPYGATVNSEEAKTRAFYNAAPSPEKTAAAPSNAPREVAGAGAYPSGQGAYAQTGYAGAKSYVQQPSASYSAPSQPTPTPPPSDTDEKKKKAKKAEKAKATQNGGDTKGFFIFLVIAVTLSVLAIVFCVFIALGGNIGTQSETPTHAAGVDDTQLTINSSPTPESSLTTIQIAENAEKINVGIMIYEETNSFISSSTTSLVGEGSGIVMGVDKSGEFTYIVTCAHVISEATNPGYSITVQDCDGNTYDGIMVGCDVKTDVGVIKIQATGLTAAVFGDSSTLKKGQKVYAIGNPGGMEFFGSFTDGMVSSIDRPISSEGGYEMECIQHTTPINSGNSGGALLNEYGQVIGINSSKIVSTGYEGMAFAIPISDAKTIIDDLIAYGYVTNRPKLGISYTPAMQYQQYAMIIQMNDLPSGSLIIRDINPDSSLASTDAEVYDLIIAADGEPLDTADVLLDKIENGSVGDKLTLTLCRVNNDYSVEEFDVTITLVADTGTTTTNQSNSSNNYWNENFGN